MAPTFFGNFGIPDFGYQNADPQGGYFAPNAASPQSQNAAPASPIAAPSPLGGGPLSLGSGQAPQQPNANPEPAPAAGIASPFNKPGA